MPDRVVFPGTYEQWRHCITVRCKVALTCEYIKQRIQVLSDPTSKDAETFRRLYGRGHLSAVLDWFKRAQMEIN